VTKHRSLSFSMCRKIRPALHTSKKFAGSPAHGFSRSDERGAVNARNGQRRTGFVCLVLAAHAFEKAKWRRLRGGFPCAIATSEGKKSHFRGYKSVDRFKRCDRHRHVSPLPKQCGHGGVGFAESSGLLWMSYVAILDLFQNG